MWYPLKDSCKKENAICFFSRKKMPSKRKLKTQAINKGRKNRTNRSIIYMHQTGTKMVKSRKVWEGLRKLWATLIMIDSRYVVRDTTYLLIFVILTFPQFISVTISPSDSVTASSPSMNTLGPYHTSLLPTLGFCWMDRYAHCKVRRPRVVPLSLCPSCVTRTNTARKKWPREILGAWSTP